MPEAGEKRKTKIRSQWESLSLFFLFVCRCCAFWTGLYSMLMSLADLTRFQFRDCTEKHLLEWYEIESWFDIYCNTCTPNNEHEKHEYYIWHQCCRVHQSICCQRLKQKNIGSPGICQFRNNTFYFIQRKRMKDVQDNNREKSLLSSVIAYSPPR